MREDKEHTLEPQDRSCECCARLSPRLSFDVRSQRLVCPQCLETLERLRPHQDTCSVF
jgi:hypothetical protein